MLPFILILVNKDYQNALLSDELDLDSVKVVGKPERERELELTYLVTKNCQSRFLAFQYHRRWRRLPRRGTYIQRRLNSHPITFAAARPYHTALLAPHCCCPRLIIIADTTHTLKRPKHVNFVR